MRSCKAYAEERSSAFFMPLYPCFGLWICLDVDKMPKIWYNNNERMVKLKDLLDITMISCEKPETCNSIEDLPLAYAYVPYQQYEKP